MGANLQSFFKYKNIFARKITPLCIFNIAVRILFADGHKNMRRNGAVSKARNLQP
jgi:hypothetical protein